MVQQGNSYINEKAISKRLKYKKNKKNQIST